MLCCCGPCCSQITDACSKFISTRKMTQLRYITLIVSFILPVVLLTFIIQQANGFLSANLWFLNVHITTPTSILIRMSLSLFLLFFILLLLMLMRNKVSQVINQGLFCIKFVVLLVFMILTFLMPASVLNVYALIARYTSIGYLAIQTVIIVDIFYLWAIKLVRQYDEGNSCCAGFLVGSAISFQAIALILIIIAFVQYSVDLCGSTSWLTIITLAIIIIIPLVQLLNFNPQNSLFTTSLITLLICYTSYAAQEWYGTGCLVRLTQAGFGIELAISVALFCISTYGTVMGGFSSNEYEDQPVQHLNSDGKEEEKVKEQNTLKEYSDHWGWMRWHLYMCLGVMYVGMVFSNWQTATSRLGQGLQGNNFVFWLKAVTSWFTALVYIWTLIVPKILPERDFRVE